MTLKGISKLLNQQGFSLTEVMVGGAVLAGVALTASQLFKDQKVAQRSITDDQKLSLFHSDLAKTMMEPSHCNATLKQFYPAGSSITPKTLDRLYKCTGGCVDTNQLDATSKPRSFDAYTSGAFDGTSFLQVGQGTDIWSTTTTDKGTTWKIESMNVVSNQTRTGPVTLRIKYKNGMSGKSVSKDLVFTARFYGGAFKECLSKQVASVDNFNNDFCKTFNFSETMIQTDGVMARWDEASQTCKFDGVKDCTSTPGMQADGIDTNGVVKCKSITTPVDALNLQNANPTTCLPPQKPRAIFDVNSKTFRVQCI